MIVGIIQPNNIGKVLKGFCNGYFGRDDYEDKVIVYETNRSICCMYIKNGSTDLACVNFNNAEEKQKYIEEWTRGEDIE